MTMLDLTLLRYFLAAYETGTFSRAAHIHGVSQPTMSTAIQKLENRLGGSLFQRSRTGLTPSALANRLYHEAVESVTHLSALERRLMELPPRQLRIYCAPDMLLRGIAPGLTGLRRGSDNLVFAFTDDPAISDIAYVSERCVPANHRFVATGTERFGVALGRHHALASRDGLTLAEIGDQNVIHRPYCPDADRMVPGLDGQGPAAQAMNDQQLLDLIAAGLGISFVPFAHGDGRDDIVILPLLDIDAGERTVGISHRRSSFAANVAKRLIAGQG